MIRILTKRFAMQKNLNVFRWIEKLLSLERLKRTWAVFRNGTKLDKI